MFLTVSQAEAAEQMLLTEVCLTWQFHPARSQSKSQRKPREEIRSSILRRLPGEEGTQLCPSWWGEGRRGICWHLHEHHPCRPLRSTPAPGKRSQSLGDHRCVWATIESYRLHVEKQNNLNLFLLHTLGSPKHTTFPLAHRWGSKRLPKAAGSFICSHAYVHLLLRVHLPFLI